MAGLAVVLASIPAAASPAEGRETEAAVRAAVARLPAFVTQAMRQTGVPGVAVAVVHQDRLVYAGGFGVRSVRRGGVVTPDTVFQIASLSKPLGATAVAAAIGRGALAWDTPAAPWVPGFTLASPGVAAALTVGDLYAHRSGLPGAYGNALERFGFALPYILQRARLEPLAPFRASYGYSNFGLTAGGEAAARAAGRDWVELTQDFIFEPLGMKASTYSHAEFSAMSNVAALHQKVEGRWVLGPSRNADAQAPAGGASSTVIDLARWMRMVLAQGRFEGRQIVAAKPLREMLSLQIPYGEDGAGGTRGYGFGMDVAVEADGTMAWSHSGAFAHGAATQVYFAPQLGLGIVTLTNGWPIGLPEAINATFVEWATYGRTTQDWLAVFGSAYAPSSTPTFTLEGQPRPGTPVPASALADYTGRYRSDYAGVARVVVERGQLALRLGPDGDTAVPLRHWSGDVFYYNQFLVMPDGFYEAVRFSRDARGRVTALTIGEFHADHGSFRRIP